MGLPGSTSLAIVASLQSTDAGAALTRALKDRGELTEDEVSIFATFQMTADAALGNFLATGVVFFTLKNAAGDLVVPTTIGVCLRSECYASALSAQKKAVGRGINATNNAFPQTPLHTSAEAFSYGWCDASCSPTALLNEPARQHSLKLKN